MADLRALVVEAGGEAVTTYIQSGNVVFEHPTRSPRALESELERRIATTTGFEVTVMLRSASELAAVVRANPFAGVEPTKLLVAFLSAEPAAGAVATMDRAAFVPEEFVLSGRDVYLHLPNGAGRARLPAALGALQTPATIRNWRTVTKLLELTPRARR